MINVSNEWKTSVTEQRQFLSSVKIIFENLTELNLDNSHIRGIKIEDSVSNGSSFTLGNAIINKLSLQLDNTHGEYSTYDFTNAEIRPSIGLQLSNTVEYIHKGVYIVDTAVASGNTITITALDYMSLLDFDYSDSTLTYPATLLQIMQEICMRHGIIFKNSSFTNSNMVISTRPDDEALTDREIVAYCAQCSGNQARFDNEGRLEFIWYDIAAFEQSANLDGGQFDGDNPYSTGDNANGGNFVDYNSGDSYDGGTFIQMNRYHHIYSIKDKNIAVDDVVITGVQVTDNTEAKNTYLVGTIGYVISISDNPLIQSASAAQTIANTLGVKIVGIRFRPLSITAVSDPSREACDVAYVSDFKGNTYQTLLTFVGFGIGALDSLRCDAETASRNSAKRYSASTKVLVEARKISKQEISTYDVSVQQLTNLITNGFGLFKTEVEDSNGGIIYYMHDKQVMDESLYRWYMTSGGIIEQKKISGLWTTVSGTDNEGNALFNVITTRGINADWVNAGTLNGIKVITNEGKIGPFTLNNTGLFGQLIEIYEQSNYPYMWFTKPGDSGWGSNHSARANFEPSAWKIREIENEIETDVYALARDDTGGTVGEFVIDKLNINTNDLLSRTSLKESSLTFDDYQSGDSFILNKSGLIITGLSNGSILFYTNDILINGTSWKDTLDRITAIEQKLISHGIT